MKWKGAVLWVCVWIARFLPCLSLWQTTLHHDVVKEDILLVNFVPADADEYDFSYYWVRLQYLSASQNLTSGQRCDGLTGEPVRSFNVTAEWPVVRQKFVNVGKAGYYCVRVTPLTLEEGGSCQNGCWTVASDIFFLKGNNKSAVYDCDKWGVIITLDLQSPERKAVVHYNVFKNISGCLHSFRIELWYKVRQKCDGTTGFRLKSTISSEPKNDLEFPNLEPGDYCVRVRPNNTTCHGQCLPHYSNIETLYPCLSDAVPEVAVPSRKLEPSPAVWLYPTILGSVLLGVTALVFAICLRKWKRRNEVKTTVRTIGDQVALENQKSKPNCDSTNPVSTEEVVVLYAQDAKEGALLLANFFHDCCNLRVCTAVSDLNLVAISPEAWVEQKLASGKIIVVESNEAVERENPLLKRQSSSDGLLDNLLENSLAFLRSKNSLVDYDRIFLVHFAKPSNGRLQFVVPEMRYALPENLLELCKRLVGAHPENIFKHPSYIELYDFCT